MMRDVLAGVLLVVLVPAVIVASASLWATRTVLDEAAFTGAVGRVLDEPTLEEAIATRVTTAAVDALARVPERLAVVGETVLGLGETPTRSRIEAALHARVLAALGDPRAQQARDAAVTAVHGFILDAARGRNAVVSVVGSEVVLDLRPWIERIVLAVDTRLAPTALGELDPASTRIVLTDAPAARAVGQAVAVMDALVLVVPLVILLAVVLVLILARSRTAALGLVGVVFMVAGLTSLVVAWLGGGFVQQAVEDETAGLVARNVYASFLSPLLLQSAILVAAGLVVGLGAWIVRRRRARRD